MFELDKEYSTKQLAAEMQITYQSFRNNKQKYEQYLSKFFEFTTKTKGRGNGTYYTLTHQYTEFIPYKDYNSTSREKTIKTAIVKTINTNNVQTGSNIARIIKNDEEIILLKLADNSLVNYVRANLKDFIDDGFYTKIDSVWCYLDELANEYILLNEKEIKELRDYLNAPSPKEEEIYSQFNNKDISREETIKQLGELRLNRFVEACKLFQSRHDGHFPMKVAVYSQNAIYNGKYKDSYSLIKEKRQ